MCQVFESIENASENDYLLQPLKRVGRSSNLLERFQKIDSILESIKNCGTGLNVACLFFKSLAKVGPVFFR